VGDRLGDKEIMQALEKLLSTPIPMLMQGLRKDERGFPIAFITLQSEDKVDFRATDQSKWLICVKERKCAICGSALTGWIYFVGGPKSIASRMFHDLGMHRECAIYGLKTCPYLAMPRYSVAEVDDIKLKVKTTYTIEVPHMSSERPDRFGLLGTRDFKVRDWASLIVEAAPSNRAIVWWRNGEIVDE
jgi:hypothetical protein